MEKLIPLLIQLIAGGAGGNIAGGLLKNVNMGKLMNTVVGVIGGVLSGQAVDWMGVLQNVLGEVGGMGNILGSAGVSGVGGALLVAIIGMIKKSMGGSAPA
jgi:hypothetical protein